MNRPLKEKLPQKTLTLWKFNATKVFASVFSKQVYDSSQSWDIINQDVQMFSWPNLAQIDIMSNFAFFCTMQTTGIARDTLK